MIRLERASKSYRDVKVVRELDLDIVDGEFFTLLGASGSGKTTTLRLIAGFERLDSGRVLLGGTVVSDPAGGVFAPPEVRGLGMVFQSYALWPHLTVAGNLSLGLEERRLPRAEISAKVAAVLAQVGLSGLDGRYPSELSGGQQQRVALARALVAEPRILLLDEPLSNLDAALREQVRGEIRALQKRLGITTVLVTHDQVEAMSISDRIGIMHEGRVVQIDKPEVLYHRPETPFVANFLGQANLLRGTGGGHSIRIGEVELQVAASLPEGPTTLLLRPECVAFGDGANAFQALIRQVVMAGSLTRYEVDVPALGMGLRIEEPSIGSLREGTITVSLPPDRMVPLRYT
jgi:ABC-type Fe3+/spermidine/putrescine transport system ATPase subunit